MERRDFVAGVVTGAAVGALGGVTGRIAWDRRHPPIDQGQKIPEFGRVSFSQQGEDIVLWHALHETFGIEKPTYLDVGAAHPKKGNNTYLLYWTGAHGVLVEPNPMFTDLLRRERPRDVVVQAGIGVTETAEADYYEIKDNPMLNTFSPDEVKLLQKDKAESVVERVVKMPLLGINRVIQEHLGAAPDLLSTDVEGLDYDILKTLDLGRFRPAVICAEDVAFRNSGEPTRIEQYLTANGYVPRGGSMYNAIYLDARRLRGSSSEPK